MPLYEGIGLINEKLPVVLEIGRAHTKTGFAGENSPRSIVPSTRPKRTKNQEYLAQSLYEIDEPELYQALVEFIQLIYFKHLLVTPKDRKVVIVESILTPTKWRMTLARVLYLHFEVLNVLWIPNHLAAAVGLGADTALVVDIGSDEARVIPLVNGVTLLNHITAHELGAAAFDENLKSLLVKYAINPNKDISSHLTPHVIEDVRIRSCFAAPILRAAMFNNIETLEPKIEPFQVKMNGNEFQYFDGVVRELAAEFWFQNEDLDRISIPLMIIDTLTKCPIDTRKVLAGSILICGGTSMIPGLKARLLRELNKSLTTDSLMDKFNGSLDFRVFNLPIEENSVSWFGGSVYGSSEVMNLRGITREYFLKHGKLPDWSNPYLNSTNYPAPVTLPTFSTSSPGSNKSTLSTSMY